MENKKKKRKGCGGCCWENECGSECRCEFYDPTFIQEKVQEKIRGEYENFLRERIEDYAELLEDWKD